MSAPRISEDLRPLSDMKTRPSDVVGQVSRTGRPVFLTRYGKGVAVLMSLESYEELQSAAAKMRFVSALREAENAIAEGDVVEHQEVEALLKKWASNVR